VSGLLVVGAGGHGKVVADTAYETGRWSKIAFLDKRQDIKSVLSWPIIGCDDEAPFFLKEYQELAVALGNNQTRLKMLRHFAKIGFSLPVIIHPSAYVSNSAVIEAGCVVFAQSAVNAGVKIGFGSILNTCVSVDHDCILEDGVHLSPGVHLAGEVTVGSCSWIGIGTSVIQGVSIGQRVIVGAGTAVIKNIGDDVTVVGVPGGVIKSHV